MLRIAGIWIRPHTNYSIASGSDIKRIRPLVCAENRSQKVKEREKTLAHQDLLKFYNVVFRFLKAHAL